MSQGIPAAITDLKNWLAVHAPPLLSCLNPPASDAQLTAFETRTGLTLPPDARQLYLLHDGEADGSDGIFSCQRWLPLGLIEAEIELVGSVGIAPIFRSGGGDLLYVKGYESAAPDHRLYEWWHEQPDEAGVVADSLESFLAEFVAGLRSGRYVYRPEELAALIDRRELPADGAIRAIQDR